MEAPLTAEGRDSAAGRRPGRRGATERALGWYRSSTARWADEIDAFGGAPATSMGLVDRDGTAEYYDGLLRVLDADGTPLADRVDRDPTGTTWPRPSSPPPT